MIILFLTNNPTVTLPLLDWMRGLDKNIIILNYDKSLDMKLLECTLPDLIISYNYDHVIKQDVIDLPKVKSRNRKCSHYNKELFFKNAKAIKDVLSYYNKTYKYYDMDI